MASQYQRREIPKDIRARLIEQAAFSATRFGYQAWITSWASALAAAAAYFIAPILAAPARKCILENKAALALPVSPDPNAQIWVAVIGMTIVGIVGISAFRIASQRWIGKTAQALRARMDLEAGHADYFTVEISDDHIVATDEGIQVLFIPLLGEQTASIILESEFEDGLADEIKRALRFTVLPASRNIAEFEFSGESIKLNTAEYDGSVLEAEMCVDCDDSGVVLDVPFDRIRLLLATRMPTNDVPVQAHLKSPSKAHC